MSFEREVVDQVAGTVAHFMNKRIRKRWSEGIENDPRIPAVKPESIAKRRRKPSRAHDIPLIDEGAMLRATHTEKRGKREAVVINTNKKAAAHFFGSPELGLPSRDVFEVVISDEIKAGTDLKIIGKMMDRFERKFTERRV